MTQVAKWIPGQLEPVVRKLLNGQPDFRSITTPATAGQELEVEHGLGRVPNGYTVISAPYEALNHGRGDTDWTDKRIFIKFSTTSREIVIAVF